MMQAYLICQYYISEVISELTAEEGFIWADSWWTLVGAGKATPSVVVEWAAVSCRKCAQS